MIEARGAWEINCLLHLRSGRHFFVLCKEEGRVVVGLGDSFVSSRLVRECESWLGGIGGGGGGGVWKRVEGVLGELFAVC